VPVLLATGVRCGASAWEKAVLVVSKATFRADILFLRVHYQAWRDMNLRNQSGDAEDLTRKGKRPVKRNWKMLSEA
jgi:hypothetical protein